MEDQFFTEHSGKILIPRLFYDSITNQPIQQCQVCERNLLDGVNYLIEKVFRRSTISRRFQVLFEYAICTDCAMKLYASYSQKSRENLERYYHEHLYDRLSENLSISIETEADVAEILSHCAFTGKHVNELDEYQIVGRFDGNYLITDIPPIMMSVDALDDLTDLLSDQTLEMLDDFTGKYLSGPPEFRDLFKPRSRPVLI